MSSMLDWALYYQSLGMSIIPVTGKTPLIPWKEFQERKASEEEIKAWWKQWPEADIGMVTGPISKRLVVDCDGPIGEKALISRGLPNSLTVQTKRGKQVHFNWPDDWGNRARTTVAGVLPELDIRGFGGYVKLPPSLFSDRSGRYTWENGLDTPLAEAPQWLLDLLIEKGKPKSIERVNGDSWIQSKLNSLAEGNRNDTFTSLAGRLRASGFSHSDIYLFLSPYAQQVEFPENELQKICNSIGSYAPKIQIDTAENFSSFLEHEEKVEWLVPGFIAKNSIGFVAGLPGSAKTWLTMDLAIEAARGGSWAGKFATKKCKVLFIDQERPKSETQRRFKALAQAKGIEAKELNETLEVRCGTTIRLNLQQSFDAFRTSLLENKPDIVIVDSFATIHTMAENDRMEIQKVLELVKQLRNEIGCTFIFINHEGKGILHQEPGTDRKPSLGDMMGSIAIPAVAEWSLAVRRKDAETCVVYMTKNNQATLVDPFTIAVEDLDEAKSQIRVRAY